ncbi:MAG: hypothetical protein Tsb0020_36290 [Haliangiales bacterium]
MSDRVNLPRVSVVIPTRDRPRSLRRLLESLARDPSGLAHVDEILVIHSGARDTSHAFDVPGLPLRHVAEPRAGVAVARNRGLAEARAPFLIWYDDDVEVTPGNIDAFLQAAMAAPSASFFAGRSEARFEAEPPAWVSDLMAIAPWIYAQLDLGEGPIQFDKTRDELPFGCNMAMWADAVRGVQFREDLGRGADLGQAWRGHQVGGEETVFFRELIDADAIGVWVPDAHVLHWNTASRMELSHVRRHFFGHGVEIALTGRARVRRYESWRIFRERVEYGWSRLLGRRPRWVRLLMNIQIRRGRRVGLRLARRRGL